MQGHGACGMTLMEQEMVRSLAKIDEALGLPADGCNSLARTLAKIAQLRTLAWTVEQLNKTMAEDYGAEQCD